MIFENEPEFKAQTPLLDLKHSQEGNKVIELDVHSMRQYFMSNLRKKQEQERKKIEKQI
jgi:hypothetical protein